MHRILLHTIMLDAPSEVYDSARDFGATALAARPRRGVSPTRGHRHRHDVRV
jgi:hypothetical protein